MNCKPSVTLTILYLSYREYRSDALNLAAIWEHSEAPYSLEKIAQSLKSPRFALYLGRKSCPLALPLNPIMVSSDNLRNVFAKAEIEFSISHPFLGSLYSKGRSVLWQWDSDIENSGFEQSMETVRRDVPINRQRWQFSERLESQFVETPSKSRQERDDD